MTNLHQVGCACEGCQATREHWLGMGMGLPAVIRQRTAEASRARTEILGDADLRVTWAPTMAEIVFKEESARKRQGRA